MLAERSHHIFEAFVCDLAALPQAEEAQRCETSQHAQSLVSHGAFVQI